MNASSPSAGAPPRRRRRRRKKRKRAEPLREALIAALRKTGLTDQARKLRIFCLYADAVGQRVAARTEPFAFSRGVLTIRVFSAAWQNELTYVKRDLIQKLNAAVGRGTIRDIRFVAGTPTLPPRPAEPEPLPACTPSEAAQAAHVAGAIGDADLRAQFEGTMKTFYRARRPSR